MRPIEVLVRLVPARLRAPVITLRAWRNRRSSPTDDHLNQYWDSDTPSRRAMLALVVPALQNEPRPHSMLDFGSHVGVNFRMLDLLLPDDPIHYYAVEPNAEAIEFLNQKMPEVESLVASHGGFLAAKNFPPGPVTLSIASGVLSLLRPQMARRVVEKMMATSSVVVLGDNIDNPHGPKSEFLKASSTFVHPFELWLRKGGFTAISVSEGLDKHYAVTGYIVARKPSA